VAFYHGNLLSEVHYTMPRNKEAEIKVYEGEEEEARRELLEIRRRHGSKVKVRIHEYLRTDENSLEFCSSAIQLLHGCLIIPCCQYVLLHWRGFLSVFKGLYADDESSFCRLLA
jgi:hypothetical protein